MRVLVTGASGFIGSALVAGLEARAAGEVIGVYRAGARAAARPRSIVGNLDARENWSERLPAGSDVLIHTAARVHLVHDSAADPLAEHRKVNVDGTLNLARHAAARGVRRFIFMSTIKVNGESTARGAAFTASDAAAPVDPYGISKWEAEQGLKEIASRSGMELVSVRPPLVYGPGVKGNFRAMLRWLARRLPLPFASVRNERSLVSLDNLVDGVITACVHPGAPGQILLFADAENLSTPELLRRTGAALQKPARLVAIPPSWLRAGGALAGKGAAVSRLLDSLRIDMTLTQRVLGWSPPHSIESGLAKTAESFLREARA
jgi:nucleoside-diphosphate-sugar epimerase